MNKLASILIGSLFSLSAVAAEQSGTAEEARAMLERAVAALKADKIKALEAFNSESGGFRSHGIYVYCSTADGTFTAHPTLKEKLQKGQNMKDVKGANGEEIGKEMLAKAKEGHIATINYMFKRPGSDKPMPRVGLVTKVGDQLCGTAYNVQP
ncbi:MAG: cache domain-containing protein [Steroidobacteraceae bacterium]